MDKVRIKKGQVVVVAQGIGSDHVPAKQLGPSSARNLKTGPTPRKDMMGSVSGTKASLNKMALGVTKRCG